MKETISKALYTAEKMCGVPVHEFADFSASSLVFSPELLKSCATNVCGHYNTSWTCPPAADTLEQQKEKILSFKYVFVFTTKHELEDSFDYEGMTLARDRHTQLTLEFRNILGDAYPIYGAGSCPSCRDITETGRCAFPEPCRFPEKRIGSIEAAGVNVTELSKAAGIKYNNGPNTVTYFSMTLFS